MNKQWLKELPVLVQEQVITQETADRIISYYQSRNQANNRLALVLGLLGALLVGSGISLIVAHNWDDFSQFVKTILAFLPLLLTQLLCVYTLRKQRDNALWKESSAVLLFFAIGTSISLIGQIYHVNGTLSGFLSTWVLLGLPLVYLFSSSAVALLCIAAITWYATIIGYSNGKFNPPYLYLPLMAAVLPHVYTVYKRRPENNFNRFLHAFIAISLLIVLAAFVAKEDSISNLIFALYLLLCCLYYTVGHLPQLQSSRSVSRPYYFLGIIGILFLLFMWSFDFAWHNGNYRYKWTEIYFPVLILIATGLILLVLILRRIFSRAEFTLHPLPYSIFIFLPAVVLFHNSREFGLLVINLWLIVIASIYIKRGADENHFGILNFGLLVIGALAVCRFFDESIPFVWRGIFFLLTGVGFFAANLLLLQKRKKQLNQIS